MATTTETQLPGYVEKATKEGLSGIKDWLKSPGNSTFGLKPGESLYTGFNGMQNKAIGNTNWLADQDISKMFGIDASKDMWDKYSKAGPETVSTWGVMDGSSPIGAFSNYMNPYTQQVLDPQIREIQKESDRQRNQIGAAAAMSGAFGDARHGIAEGQNFQKTNQAISDATGQAYNSAFQTALGARQQDLGRFFQKDTANQSAQQNANERLGTVAQAYQGLGNDFYTKLNDVNDSLFNAGSLAQGQEEKKRQALQAFQTALMNKDYDSAMKLLGAVGAAPAGQTQTQTSDTGIWGLLGALTGIAL